MLDVVDVRHSESWLSRIGIPPSLAWGFLGIFLFMIGDGVESGYLSPYLVSRGLSTQHVAWIFTTYGLVVAVAGWLSGALSDAWGPRRVVFLGLLAWVGFQCAFLLVGLNHGMVSILLTYGARGLGYPLFAFGFLVWIAVATPANRLASAVGWFWFAFSGGLPMLGSLVAGWCLPRFGPVTTMWIALGIVTAGGVILLVGVREPRGRRRLVSAEEKPLDAVWRSITLLWRRPRTGIACIVRVINSAPEFGFFVFMPAFFTNVIGFTIVQWLHLLSAMFLSNILWNLAFGWIGDWFGWRRTVAICGGLGCAITTLSLYYVPLWRHSFTASLIVAICYGATLAGFIPLSALAPNLAPEEKGAAMALLNLGAGTGVWVGPAIVGLLLSFIGVKGVMWVFGGLYVLSAILAIQLKLPKEALALGAEN